MAGTEEKELVTNNPHQVPYQTWEQYKLTLDKNIGIIEVPNNLYFENDTLAISSKEFPYLKILYACNCALKKVELDCPTLETLNLNNNELEEIDLSKVLNLRTLIVSNNELKNLYIKRLKKLEDLKCFANKIASLNCSRLKELKNIDCSDNIWGFSGNKKTKRKSFCLNYINLDGCENLESLDADMNQIENIDFDNLSQLKKISLRENGQVRYYNENEGEFTNAKTPKQTKSLLLDSPYLTHIDVKLSDVKEIYNQGVLYDPANPQPFLNTLNEPSKLRLIDNYTDEANWHENAPTWWEHDAYQRQQLKEKTNRFLEGQEDLDMSNENLIGEVFITQGYSLLARNMTYFPLSARSINLSDNFITKLTISNFPNLERLIISYNLLTKPIKVINCPKYEALLAKEQAQLKGLTEEEKEKQTKVFYHYKYNDLPLIHWSEVDNYLERDKKNNDEVIFDEEMAEATIKVKSYWKELWLGAGILSFLLLIVFYFKRQKKLLY